MLSIGNDTELITELNSIFNRVAPSVQIFASSTSNRFDIKKIAPANIEGYSIVSWQHLGFSLPLYFVIYKSIKINIPHATKDKKFPEQLF